MKSIDREKLSKEIYDNILHRKCVLRSGMYLATYLKTINQDQLAEALINRCLLHDLSKLENTDEFTALASIVNQNCAMRNVHNELTPQLRKIIQLHWKHNTHHPEHYASPNDMSVLDIIEMACDCHARSKQFSTDLIEYITVQQEKRFHFDEEHYQLLLKYCTLLVKLTREDKYIDILNNDLSLCFLIGDPAVRGLENFKDSSYIGEIETERLILQRSIKSDFSSIIYIIKTKNNMKTIGEITILCNGKIYYTIPKRFRNRNYIIEVLNKFKEIIKRKELSLQVGDKNLLEQQMVTELGFTPTEDELQGIRTFKFVKSE